MIIPFDTMEEKAHQSFKGGEGTFFNKVVQDEHNKILNGRLAPGSSIGLHTHEGNSEIIFILSGKGKALYDGAYEPVHAGVCHYCPMGHSHSLINDGDEDLIFCAVVPQHPVAP